MLFRVYVFGDITHFFNFCGTVIEGVDQTAFSFRYGLIGNFAMIPVQNKDVM